MYSIIPDIHADLDRLQRSLAACGTRAPFAFLGDFIDGKGAADDAGVLGLVRPMIARGEAVAVMGNHELNAILFHRKDAQGRPLRAHSDKNRAQHESFVNRFGIATSEALDWTGWFLRALPLWRDEGGMRLVHACWNDAAIATIRARRPDGHLAAEDLEEVAAECTPFGRAVKLLVSGPETRLPHPWSFRDSRRHLRHEVRLAWWRGHATTWREAALSVPNPADLPDLPLPADLHSGLYPRDWPPVFVGHYKMAGVPMVEAANALCLDYPGTACAYLWQGESRLCAEHLVCVPEPALPA